MGYRRWLKSSFVYFLILVAIAALFLTFFASSSPSRSFMDISEVVSDAKRGLISRIEVQGSTGDLLVTYWDEPKTQYASRVDRGESIMRLLLDAGVELDDIQFVITPSSSWSDILTIAGGLLPFLVVGGLFYFIIRQAQSGNQVARNLIRHAWNVDQKPLVTFSDVGGMAATKEAVADIVAYLKDPKHFGEAGGRMPRAVLVSGPSGVGKGLFVRAVAGEAGVKLITANSSEFIELFVGVGSGRVHDLFQEAQKLAPVAVFIDELDAIGRMRGEMDKQSTASEQQLLLSQLFIELDQLHAKRGVVLFAATNRPDLVDPALLRAGRLERHIRIEPPTEGERLEILKILVRGKSLAQDVRLEEIARETEGRTGADLAAMVNQAAFLAVKGTPARTGGAISREDMAQAQRLLKVTA